jgi:hypothetical protein
VTTANPDALLRSIDGGPQLRADLQPAGAIDSVAFFEGRLYIHDLRSGMVRSTDLEDPSFEPVPGAPRASCLTPVGDRLLACANYQLDRYVVGESTGGAFTALLTWFGQVPGPIRLPGELAGGDRLRPRVGGARARSSSRSPTPAYPTRPHRPRRRNRRVATSAVEARPGAVIRDCGWGLEEGVRGVETGEDRRPPCIRARVKTVVSAGAQVPPPRAACSATVANRAGAPQLAPSARWWPRARGGAT